MQYNNLSNSAEIISNCKRINKELIGVLTCFYFIMANNPINFTTYDITRCLLALEEFNDRKSLSYELDLGEGIVRTILEKLKDQRIISSTKHGHALTKKGVARLKKIRSTITLFDTKISYYRRLKSKAIIIRDARPKLKSFELRDLAIKNGAEACLVFYFNNELLMPPGDFVPIEFKNIAKDHDLKNKDWLIICIAHDKKWAEIACLAVAERLLKV